MRKFNRSLFERLEDLLPKETVVSSNLKTGVESVRHIKTDPDEEIVLKKAKLIKHDQINSSINSFVVEIEAEWFLILTGAELLEEYGYHDFLKGIRKLNDDDCVSHQNSGLITFLWAQNEYPFSRNDWGIDLADKVFCREGIEEGEFDSLELQKYFVPHYIWAMDKELFGNLNSSVLKAICSALIVKSEHPKTSLFFSENTQYNFLLLIENSDIDLIGEIIWKALSSTTWSYCFLELYRCIEFLYPIPYLNDFAIKLGEPSLLEKLYANTEDVLDWRPRENQALERLIRELGVDTEPVQNLKSCFAKIEVQKINSDENISSSVANRIYKLRNSIAHFRLSLKYPINQDSHFDELIGCMISLVYHLYNKHSLEISKIKAYVQ